jgi:hypothetical protein
MTVDVRLEFENEADALAVLVELMAVARVPAMFCILPDGHIRERSIPGRVEGSGRIGRAIGPMRLFNC